MLACVAATDHNSKGRWGLPRLPCMQTLQGTTHILTADCLILQVQARQLEPPTLEYQT